MKHCLSLALVALLPTLIPVSARAGNFIEPSTFPPLSDGTVAAMNDTYAKLLKEPGVARVGFYQFLIDNTGHLTKIGVAQSSGDATDDDEAIAAIEATTFDPAPNPGQQTYRLIPLRFSANQTIYFPPAKPK